MLQRLLPTSLFLLCTALAASKLLAQPILGVQTLPAPSRTIPLLWCDTTAVTPGPAGAGVVWNFANLRKRTAQPDSMNVRYAAMAELPQEVRDSFPSGEVAIVDDTTTTVCATVQGRFRVLGVVSTSAHIMSSPVDPYDSRPTELVFNGSFQDAWRAQITVKLAPVTLQRAANHRITYDGFGTLQLPNVTFTGVGRTTDSLTIVDTLRQGPNVVVITTRAVNVTWLQPDANDPLLQIQSTSTTTIRNGVPFGQRVTTKTVRSFAWTEVTSVVDEDSRHTFRISPNPVNGSNVRIGPLHSAPHRVRLYSAQGAAIEVRSVTPESDSYWSIQLPDVGSGAYTMVVEGEHTETLGIVRAAQLVIVR